MDIRYTIGKNEYKRMTTEELRDSFLISIFETGKLNLLYCEVERGIVGAAVPTDSSLSLEAGEVESRDDVPLFLGGPVCPEAATCLVCPQSRHPPGSELFGYKESLLAFAIDISRHTPPRVAMIEHFFNLHPLTNC